MQMNDWLRHTFTQYYIKYYTQYYIKYINIAMLANFQHKPLKLAGLIAEQERHLWLKKFIFMAAHYFPVHTHLFQYVSGFQLEKNWTRSKTRANIFLCLLDHPHKAQLADISDILMEIDWHILRQHIWFRSGWVYDVINWESAYFKLLNIFEKKRDIWK